MPTIVEKKRKHSEEEDDDDDDGDDSDDDLSWKTVSETFEQTHFVKKIQLFDFVILCVVLNFFC